MIYLIKIFILIFLFGSNANSESNKILFEIKNQGFTNVDIERRIKYLEFNNNSSFINLNQSARNEIQEDYISSLLFFEYYKENNFKFKKLQEDINIFYDQIVNVNKSTKKLNDKEISNIKKNIKIDLIRKKIIEKFLNNEKKILSKKTESLDLIYNYDLNYIIINKNDVNLNLIEKIQNRKDFVTFRKNLSDEKISYFFKQENINDNTLIPSKIKNFITNNNKIFTIINEKYISIYSLEKNLESYEGVYVKLLNLNVVEPLNTNELNCDFVKKIDNKTEFKEYEYSLLNLQIKENLKSVDDYIYFKNEDGLNYIFLCELRYDEKILNNINFNKKIMVLANNLQNKFINKYKKKYNLIINK